MKKQRELFIWKLFVKLTIRLVMRIILTSNVRYFIFSHILLTYRCLYITMIIFADLNIVVLTCMFVYKRMSSTF